MEYQYDFKELAQRYTYLKPFVDGNKYEFSHEGLGKLTRAILKRDFNVEFEPLNEHLCPAIPSRLAYLDHVNQILQETQYSEKIKGLDIGTGAYAIYALLGNKKYEWEMHGSDIDHDSIDKALKLIQKNHIGNVKLHKVVESDCFFGVDNGQFSFTMCNPPFYESKEEMIQNSNFKEKLSRDQVIASDSELVTPGGELAFVSRMIRQSPGYGEKIQWFSSLLGKRQSIDMLIDVLKDVGCKNYLIRDYQLGKTKRWILFWSLQCYRPKVLNEYKLITPTVVSFEIELGKVETVLKDLPLEFHKGEDDTLAVITNGDVWSRSFRRKKQKPNELDRSIFKINNDSIYWSFGPSSIVFQSFHTYIRKHQ